MKRDPRNLTVDTQTKQIKLSSILSWFGEDFGKKQSDQLRTVMKYFPESAKSAVSQSGYSIGYLEYDWNLNAKN